MQFPVLNTLLSGRRRGLARSAACARPLLRLAATTLVVMLGSTNFALAAPRDIVATLSTAYTSNPEILTAQRNIFATHEEIPIALQRFMPRLNATAEAGSSYLSAQRYRDVAPQDLRQRIRTMGLTLSQPIYDGQAIPGYRAANALVLRARAQLLQAEEAVLQDAAISHINILRDREILRLRDAYLVLLRNLAAVTERLVEAGDRTVGDLAQVRAQEARALSAQLQARRDIALAEAAYLRAVTIPAGELAPPCCAINCQRQSILRWPPPEPTIPGCCCCGLMRPSRAKGQRNQRGCCNHGWISSSPAKAAEGWISIARALPRPLTMASAGR